ncbi:PIN domain-containing protein [Peribacillus frigoritolerans]|uniref:PIN domain-containing protein n=1 Tax=Peribacillus frigoritolerans TaxID=450367 RepID=UPI0021D3E6F4|nr:PIN domain-containing protein [Peribacillus frigoritolerans]MCU6603924.1 PIN domain-containing protein [Peribacillus frigoritolerans]
MKYLLLDTNIYIDMIVSRSSSHTADSYELLKMLLDHDKVKIILPAIIETEIKRHIASEIHNVGTLVQKARTSINQIYWINHIEEIKKYNEKIKPLSRSLGNMDDEFSKNEERYINEAAQKITELMQYKNVIRIEENSSLLLNVQKRKLYKLCPFHIEEKESWADAMIIETLINIRDFIEIKDEDQIYFITRNHKDFSKGNSKTEREIIHPHIEEQLIKNKLIQLFHYRSLYTKTLLEDFSEETKEADIYQSLMEEAEEEKRAMIDSSHQDILNMERESVGLTLLSSDDTYYERISESTEIEGLIGTNETLLSSLYAEIEDVIEEYNQFDNDTNAKPVTDLIAKIQAYNVGSPFLQISYENSFTEEDVRDAVLEFVNDYLCPVEALESTRDSIKYKDYFEFNELLSFTDLKDNTVTLSVKGQLDPRNDDTDSIRIELHKNEDRISSGVIEVYYGYMNFDEDGGASDGSTESIDYRLEKVINDLTEIVQEYSDSINKIRDNLIKVRAILTI